MLYGRSLREVLHRQNSLRLISASATSLVAFVKLALRRFENTAGPFWVKSRHKHHPHRESALPSIADIIGWALERLLCANSGHKPTQAGMSA
jgi:hypothetical protein